MIRSLAILATSGLVFALGAFAQPKATAAAAQTKTPAKKAPATGAQPFKRVLLTPANLKEQAPPEFEAKFVTTKGDFVIKVTREWSPLGADRFYNLVKSGFYDGASFFRVVPGFVVQFGISAYPEVSAPWREARINDEPVKSSNKRGFVTYAKGGPNSRTTQVFINLRDNARLDGMGFSPFGEVTQGMEIVEQLHAGYGDGPPGGNGPNQGRIQMEGRKYLEADFPSLDSIRTATIVSPAPAPPPKSPAKKSPAKKAPAAS